MDASARADFGVARVASAIAAFAAFATFAVIEREFASAGVSARAGADRDGEFMDVAGVGVHYKRARFDGRARRVAACAHGFGANVSSWCAHGVLKKLSEALEADCAAHDACGFGFTERAKDVGKYGRASDARVMRTIADALKKDLKVSSSAIETVLVGHSLGAIGAALACAKGGVDRVVLVAPAIVAGKAKTKTGRLPKPMRVAFAAIAAAGTCAAWCLTYIMKPFIVFILRALVRRKQFWINGLSAAVHKSRAASMLANPDWIEGYRRPSIVRNWEDGMFNVVLASVAAVNSPTQIFSRALSKALRDDVGAADDDDDDDDDAITALVNSGVRVLIVHGENDVIVPASNSKKLAERIPNAQLVIMPNCGHMPHEEYPDEFVQIVKTFCT